MTCDEGVSESDSVCVATPSSATLTFRTGDSYTGSVVSGRMSGGGCLTLATGDRLTGQFSNSGVNFTGRVEYVSGHVYEGDATVAEPLLSYHCHGQGQLTFADGIICSGRFIKSKLQSPGSLFFPNGDQYSGECKLSDMHGYGSLSFASSGTVFTGRFTRNQQDTVGNLRFLNNDVFSGHCVRDKMHGQGTLTYYRNKLDDVENDKISYYEGSFRMGVCHGYG